MSNSIQAFNIQTIGIWPNETYQINPLDQYIDPNAGFLPAENMFRYLNNSLNETDSFHTVNYSGITYNFSPIVSQYAIDTTPNSKFVWDLTSHRKNYNFGPQFNYFYALSNPGTDAYYRKYYAYLLYPARLFLKPLSLQKNASSWTLTTSTVLVSPQTYFFSGSSHEFPSYLQHTQHINTKPTFYPLPIDTANNFIFELSACRMMKDVPVVSFTGDFNPYSASRSLDRIGGCIRPDSTFISYNVDYTQPTGSTSSLGQVLPDTDPLISHAFKTSYILNQSELSSGKLQKFQLLQNRPQEGTKNLGDSSYCILSAVFNLSSTNLQYFNLQFIKENFTHVNAVTGRAGSIIGASYIIDSDKFLFSNESCQSTFTSFQINGSVKTLGIPVNYQNLTSSSTWITKYPPHYYSYKTSLYSPSNGYNSKADTCNLTFFLQTSVLNLTTSNALLSSFIGSDYNALTYNLPDNNLNEYIKFELLSDNSLFRNNNSLSAINFYYGPSLNVPYNIEISPWVPVSSACKLFIDYPGTPYGETFLTIRSTLSSPAGYLASKEAVNIFFAPNQTQSAVGSPIFLDLIDQPVDAFDVTSAFLTAAPQWPTKNLIGSFISWDFFPKTIGAQLYSIDSLGNPLLALSANEKVAFSDLTQNVRLSGTGFSTVVIYLSSQKYNQTTSLTSNSALYDPFVLNKFIIGPNSVLSNVNRTRTISLTALLPYGNQLYSIPYNTPVSWTWDYTTNTAPSRGPINAYYGPNKTPYVYATEMSVNVLSSIYLEITPTDNDSIPVLNHVRAHLSSKVRVPAIYSTYEFVVDDFPARSVLNSDFRIGYTSFQSPSGTILDTGLDQYVLTRPQDGTNILSLSSYANSHISPSTTYVWTISDNANTLSSVTVPYSNHFINYNIKTAATATYISLSAVKAVVDAWGNVNITDNSEFLSSPEHSVETSVYIYTPTSAEFYKPLEFVIYPEYAWLGGRQLTLLTPSNYTLSKAPSAYSHKKSSSQTFWVSANKKFNEYNYCIGSSYKFLSSVNANIGLIDIPYTTELSDVSGLMISLSGFSLAYPSYASIYYVKPENGVLKTFTFPITAQTQNLSGNPSLNVFKSNPYIVPHKIDTVFNFSLATTSLDLDYTRIITLTQHITTSPLEAPAQPLKDFGTITYLLSTDYWAKEITVPSIDGTFDAISLNIGDPFEEGYISNSKTNHLSFRPLFATMPYQIPSSTFDNYSIFSYASARDLWSPYIQTTSLSATNEWQTLVAYYTGSMPQAFLSTYIALTGQEIYIEFTSPDELEHHYITHCVTNFGELSGTFTQSVSSDKNQPAKYTYNSSGSFFIQYEVFYNDGTSKINFLPDAITIFPQWTVYNQEAIRTINEASLAFNYSLDQIKIQPNEWGDVDIFNTAISRLHDNLQYLRENSQTIDTDSPSMFYGWLGCNSFKKSEGIRWYAKNFDELFYEDLNFATNSGSSSFSNIQDVAATDDYIFVLDNFKLRGFYNKHYKPVETLFVSSSDISSSWDLEMVAPCSMDIDTKTSNIYVVDPPRNKVVCLNIDYSTPAINFSVNIGGFGSKNDSGKFNAPSQVIVSSDSVFVLDYNNQCVKEYTTDLNWIHTYFTEDFNTDQPISIASTNSGTVYILTKSMRVYIFIESNPSTPLIQFSLLEMMSNKEDAIKMILDENGSFLYITTPTKIFKYTSTPIKNSTTTYIGTYIGIVDFKFPSSAIKKATNQNLLIATPNAVAKVQDIVSLFKIGDGLPYQMWSLDQLLLDKQEFASDVNYNKSLVRLTQNIKTFRNNLNSRFVKIYKKTDIGDLYYFALDPVPVGDQPQFEKDVENESVNIGVNELHIPQVFNRELTKIYNALDQLRLFLNISDLSLSSASIIKENFCWSWKSTACHNLTLPSIKVANVNPITFTELKKNFPIEYAPSKLWKDAVSNCCS